ncbi:MAG: two-component system, OmpR family, sensor histidine kinase CpxA [Blastocatellia bacterium]|jgi:two-component system sensor histidine kinase CpxA|nr:two-component system, OmpR family, sensor histidine kinase CpxA [Blastocatellia bacterium]
MRSLFLKIFIWFGLVMVVANVASFLTGIAIERRSQFPRQSPMTQVFAVYAQSAVEVFERDGKTALASYLERVEHVSNVNAVLFDSLGNEVSGRTVPEGVLNAISRVTEQSPYVFYFLPQQSRPFAAQLIRGPQGANYVLAGVLPKPDFPPRLGEPGSLAFGLRIIARSFLPVLLVGGLFCFWLASYLSTPIVQLRGATHELSAGNLDARVNQKLLRRRDEIGKLGRDFNVMAGRIESLVGAQRRLLGDISHELRSPLARQGVALGLARRSAGPLATSALDRIGREAERLNEMIGQLLSLSRVETGTDRLQNAEIDLSALVKEVAEDADFEARGRERSVLVISDKPLAMRGVFELIRSAIENVVRNGVRYTDAGTPVEISLTSEAANDDRFAVISVRDHGKGVPPESIQEIFRPFYRVEDDRDRKTGGTGLGLSIAARAVHLHHGTIKAANASDGGLIVEIRLPIS